MKGRGSGVTDNLAILRKDADFSKFTECSIWHDIPVDGDSLDSTSVVLLSKTALALKRLPNYRDRLPEGEIPGSEAHFPPRVKIFSVGATSLYRYTVAVTEEAGGEQIAGIQRILTWGRDTGQVPTVHDSSWHADRWKIQTPFGDIPIQGVTHLVPFGHDVVVFQNRGSYGGLGVLQAFHWDGQRWHRTLYVPTSVYPLPNGLFRVNDRCVLLTARDVELYCLEETP